MDLKVWANIMASSLFEFYSFCFFLFEDTSRIADIKELKAVIVVAVCAVVESMLKKTWLELEHLLRIPRAFKGAHGETF